MLTRGRIEFEGIVQGVGFRPALHRFAEQLGLRGWVMNTSAGVLLEVEGGRDDIEEFIRLVREEGPPLSRVLISRVRWLPVIGFEGFSIKASRQLEGELTLLCPDVATCADCARELADPEDRRYRYAFINCTNCGPRYTIIQDLPYDRPFTTMKAFTMCPACQAEYDNPGNRRFHAQPNACPECGPRLWLTDAEGAEIDCDPVEGAAQALKAGEVVAVKGLGGFHLAADAFNEEAVVRLRTRKLREEKPLALMAPNLEAARRLVELDPVSEAALISRQRPIVLCPQKPESGVASSVNPRNRLLGVMLPYTPLHHLLMDQGFQALVMTSGNVSDEPICLDNQEALCRIGGQAPRGAIADKLLLHNRDIYLRSDDSVVRVVGGSLRYLRRSRGFVPVPLKLAQGLAPPDCPPVLATGAHLKNTLCLLRGREAFVSQHVGDLENLETLEFFELTAGHLERILEASPEVLVCDLHPDYLSTRWAMEAADKRGLPLVRVQHHHAHAVALMAEHGLAGPVLGLSLDGTGYGPDGTVWGGELLKTELHDYQRVGHVRRFALPGGEAAVKQPWRVALGILLDIFGEDAAGLDLELVRIYGEHLPLMKRMKETGLNTPLTSSLGRLFDAAAALCGLRFSVAYEGQAAIELEQAMEALSQNGYESAVVEEEGLLLLDWRGALRELVDDVISGAYPAQVSTRFHAGLISGLAEWTEAGAAASGLTQVCLGGGCLLNAALLTNLPPLLKARGLEAYTPQQMPAGDGGLSLGQALAGAVAWQRGLNVDNETVLGPSSEEL